MKVDIYWNLHRHKWSIRHKGKVVGHADNAVVEDCEFVVGAKGRLRVIREKRKNVHAFVRGELIATDVQWLQVEENLFPKWKRVSYNPYVSGSFSGPSGFKVVAAKLAVLGKKKVFGFACI